MKVIPSGRLRQKVTLQQLQTPETFDSFGQPLKAWTTVGTFWAEIRPLIGQEAYVARQMKAEATHMMTLRYLGGGVTLNPTMQFLYGDRTFGIVEVRNVDERNWQYDLTVREIQTRTTRV